MKKLSELKNIHLNKDIWCVAAGSSMDYVDPSFFENKIVIGQNQVYKKYKCDYVVMKDLMETPRFPRSIEEVKQLDIPLIYPKHHMGHYAYQLNQVNYENSYIFEHNDNRLGIESALSVIGTEFMTVIRSTMTTIMNIAAYMGAKNIIICGVDCGRINNNLYYENYVEPDWTSSGNWNQVEGWLQVTQKHNLSIRDKIKEVYKCNIYSLNPFMNFKLDGNEYKAC